MNSKLLHYNNARIVLSHERSEKVKMDLYPSHHLLTYIRDGVLQVSKGDQQFSFHKGEAVLLRKFHTTTITKTPDEKSGTFASLVFTFHEDLVQEALLQLNLPLIKPSSSSLTGIIALHPDPVVDHFFGSLQLFLENGVPVDHVMARLKTLEVLAAILRSDIGLAAQFQDLITRSKADLHAYMNAHFTQNRSLEEFARASGRSLSAFKRDFAALYGVPPQKWLKEKRLNLAYQILIKTHKRPSQVYLECGFEDLAHFSRSFKAFFKINPSEVKDHHSANLQKS